jgi:uncharacterized repeat protein (TIGR02543 family)
MGGTPVSSDSVDDGSRISAPNAPTRPGYNFVGWFTDSNYRNQWYFDINTVTQDITLYAKWQRPTWDCGAAVGSVTAVLDNGVLTISGYGMMADFTYGNVPWAGHASAITSVVIKNGVTTIGDYAFFGCEYLASVTIAGNVAAIGRYAFAGSYSLSTITSVASPPPAVWPNAFTDVQKQACYVNVPLDAIANYRNAAVWKDFFNLNVMWGVSGSGVSNPQDGSAVVVAPVAVLAREITAGPNPVARSSGSVAFFRQGKQVKDATLTVYDASGNVVRKVKITDKSADNLHRRQIGEWDLRDARGRAVAAGTYLVRGIVKSADGQSEKVSLVLGVR